MRVSKLVWGRALSWLMMETFSLLTRRNLAFSFSSEFTYFVEFTVLPCSKNSVWTTPSLSQKIVRSTIIHHDNARPHTSLETRTALDRLGLRTLPHPPYSPDLAPSDFFLFPKLNITSRATVTRQTKMWRMLLFLGAETRLLTSSLTASNRSSVGGGSVSNGTVIMLKNDMSSGAK